jgi:hypothetical protein
MDTCKNLSHNLESMRLHIKKLFINIANSQHEYVGKHRFPTCHLPIFNSYNKNCAKVQLYLCHLNGNIIFK